MPRMFDEDAGGVSVKKGGRSRGREAGRGEHQRARLMNQQVDQVRSLGRDIVKILEGVDLNIAVMACLEAAVKLLRVATKTGEKEATGLVLKVVTQVYDSI